MLDIVSYAKSIEAKQVETVDTIDTEEIKEVNVNEVVKQVKSYLTYSIKLIVIADENNNFDVLFDLLTIVPINTINLLQKSGGTPNTLINNRSKIFSDLEREFNKLTSKKDRFLYFLSQIRKAVYESNTFQKIVAERRESNSQKIKERKQNRTEINPTRLIDWSIEVLSTLDKRSKIEWKMVTQALKLLTGRRTSEILSSAKFVPSKVNGCLRFKGQNKKYSEYSFNNEQPLLIPVISGQVDLVLDGMLWLENSGKRIKAIDNTWDSQREANVKVSQNLGARLTSFCQGKDSFKLNWYGLIESSDDWQQKQKPDCTRDIYTQIIGVYYYENLNKGLTGTLDFLAQILGHSDDKSIVKYDIDFCVQLSDIEKYLSNIDFQSIP